MDKTEASDMVLFCLSLIYGAVLILIFLGGFQFLHIQHP